MNGLRFIRSTFKDPNTGKWIVGFKLANKIPEFHSLSIYLSFTDPLKSRKHPDSTSDPIVEQIEDKLMHIYAVMKPTMRHVNTNSP